MDEDNIIGLIVILFFVSLIGGSLVNNTEFWAWVKQNPDIWYFVGAGVVFWISMWVVIIRGKKREAEEAARREEERRKRFPHNINFIGTNKW